MFCGKHPELGWMDTKGNPVELNFIPENDFPVLKYGDCFVSTNVHDFKMYDHAVLRPSLNCDLAAWVVVPKTFNRLIACMRGTTVMYVFEDAGYMNFPASR